ncbi:hypothetical protein EV646_108205 [Kribbella antiqua]|uniref:Uncharacterized protein n=1 Tax=Kribbella antiqua TaxID=2512217 RepID=A0A4R2IM41_9ACTN|nr:hypothetical protein [Kribbella antiqua]TCO45582.1 hypothetical protein EV646_108205 [Kribbella antiqua]
MARSPAEEDEGSDQAGTVVVGVPQGKDAQLIVTFAGVDQTVSFTTGERTSKTAATYYRSKSTADLTGTYGPHRVVKGDFGLEHQTHFTKVTVLPSADGLGWAKSGTMWVAVGTEGSDVRTNLPGTRDYFYSSPVSSPRTAQLVDARSHSFALAGKLVTTMSSEGDLVFQVPETTRSVTLRYAPTATFAVTRVWSSQANPTGGTVTLPSMTVKVDLPQ